MVTVLHDEGGDGRPIVLLHGLMGSARTWRRQVPWLRALGHVYSYDAPGHRRPPPAELTTEAFVEDLFTHVEPLGSVIVVGHSMGALHGWCLASAHPGAVSAIVVEDISPDFTGRTATDWAAMIRQWPVPFRSREAVLEFFGPVAGQYFLDSFYERSVGWDLHGSVDTFEAISAEWGNRDFWQQWDAARIPALLIEGEHSITPPGQMSQMHARNPTSSYVRVAGAAHLIHDERPVEYRTAVEGFLARLP